MRSEKSLANLPTAIVTSFLSVLQLSEMTFIDDTVTPPSPELIAGYTILTLVSLACTVWAIHLGRHRTHYRLFFSVRVLFPIAILILALENAILAATGKIVANSKEDDTLVKENPLVKSILILQCFEVPILLIVIFEVTYLIHKRRSVNFCGMYFDEGRRLNNTQAMSCMLRNSIRTLATILLVMGLLVNFDFIQSDAKVDELAGRAGWYVFFNEEGSLENKLHLFLSLIPIAVLVVYSFYLSIMLWRYGTSSSMIVHSSICNPWFYSFFGTLAMAAGQLFAEYLYPIMSNTGILIFIITVEAVMVEVDKDIVAIENEASFLVCVALKGDQISIALPSTVEQRLINDNAHDEETATVSDHVDATTPIFLVHADTAKEADGVVMDQLIQQKNDRNNQEAAAVTDQVNAAEEVVGFDSSNIAENGQNFQDEETPALLDQAHTIKEADGVVVDESTQQEIHLSSIEKEE